MNLNKSNWSNSLIRHLAIEISERTENPSLSGYERFVGLEEFETGEFKIRKWITTENLVSAMKLFNSGDILFARRNAYLRRTSEVDFDGVCSGDAIVLRPNDNSVKGFLTLLLNTDKFWEYAIANAAGTMSKRVKWRDLAEYTFLLPPLDEQQRIVDLFQSIEQSITHAEEQEKNLRKLCKSLVDGLISDKPIFGNLLKSKKLKRVYYRDIARKLTRKINPVDYGVERIVAGENLEAEDFKIRTWGTVGKDFLGPAFHVLFQAGDILYGSRRTYLKKVALADFEGVCANTTYVIRADEEILLQDLLKHIMLSERFTQYSIGVSKGSTNPYINWKDLDNFVFEIPDLDAQKMIANLLDEILANAEKVREQIVTLKKLKQKLLNEILGG